MSFITLKLYNFKTFSRLILTIFAVAIMAAGFWAAPKAEALDYKFLEVKADSTSGIGNYTTLYSFHGINSFPHTDSDGSSIDYNLTPVSGYDCGIWLIEEFTPGTDYANTVFAKKGTKLSKSSSGGLSADLTLANTSDIAWCSSCHMADDQGAGGTCDMYDATADDIECDNSRDTVGVDALFVKPYGNLDNKDDQGLSLAVAGTNNTYKPLYDILCAGTNLWKTCEANSCVPVGADNWACNGTSKVWSKCSGACNSGNTACAAAALTVTADASTLTKDIAKNVKFTVKDGTAVVSGATVSITGSGTSGSCGSVTDSNGECTINSVTANATGKATATAAKSGFTDGTLDIAVVDANSLVLAITGIDSKGIAVSTSAQLTFNVRKASDNSAVSGASINITSNSCSSPSNPSSNPSGTTDSSGDAKSTFTAPSAPAICLLTAEATMTGFSKGVSNYSIAVTNCVAPNHAKFLSSQYVKGAEISLQGFNPDSACDFTLCLYDKDGARKATLDKQDCSFPRNITYTNTEVGTWKGLVTAGYSSCPTTFSASAGCLASTEIVECNQDSDCAPSSCNKGTKTCVAAAAPPPTTDPLLYISANPSSLTSGKATTVNFTVKTTSNVLVNGATVTLSDGTGDPCTTDTTGICNITITATSTVTATASKTGFTSGSLTLSISAVVIDTCSNGKIDPGETAIDCGGGGCSSCCGNGIINSAEPLLETCDPPFAAVNPCTGGQVCNSTCDGCIDPPCSGKGMFESPLSSGYCFIGDILTNATGWILTFVSSIIVLILIVGGLMYISSAGDEEKLRTAKNIIYNGLIGFGIILISYALISEVTNILKG